MPPEALNVAPKEAAAVVPIPVREVPIIPLCPILVSPEAIFLIDDIVGF